jgi:hypothetical protein
LYPTDCLRIHEEVQELQANLTALGRMMTLLEHIAMIGYLNFFFKRRPQILGSLAFIIDGPLALFGPQAWLHRYILSYLRKVHDSLKSKNYRTPLIIGIEKTGYFAEHADAIRSTLERRTLVALPDAYIFERIIATRESQNSAYGRDEYYGRKFIYKNAKDQMLIFTVPLPSKGLIDPHEPSHYPELPRILYLLDQIGTLLYQDAVIPVALAHSAASIPLTTGSKILKLLSQKLLREG